MAEAKKAQSGKQKKRTWTHVTDQEKEEIVQLHNTGKYSQEEIAKKVRRGSGTVSVIIRAAKGVYPKTENTVQKELTNSITTAKDYKLLEREKNLHPDIIKLLQTSKSRDEFVMGYIQKSGFNSGITIQEIIQEWTRRFAILKFEKEKKEEEKKEKEQAQEKKMKDRLLSIAAAKKKTTIESPLINERRQTFPDEGEQLVKINNHLAEMIVITKEILQVQKNTYTLFKEKMDGGKKTNDVGVGTTAGRLDK